MRLITKTDGIMRFLAGQPTEKICAVLAHAEDGKLAYMSCCCLIGCFTADHALRPSYEIELPHDTGHLFKAKKMPHGKAAEAQFNRLWKGNDGDAIRRHRIIPLLRYELRRRESQVRGPVAAPRMEATHSAAVQAPDVGEAGQPTSRKDVLAK